ncbi:YlxM family DNA-binding protein [Carboxydothermus ferrireducens]|uniref:UPF0122 protein HDG70_001955 n=1 Tax=Carboxydothermus ferrireducens DSM 11255 TaxID=1119529 RepID=A0ABX2RAK3_9THEO|nr:sigma-70 family RNA polymerase sigma factor [Carboxydothermus ferrireducens]NYE58204.1 hypothetical protein [Carboxydothermus ferrireducens DSM 11255]
MIDEFARNGSLLELYGGLLTEKQREILELYYIENWSLAEIAEYLKISRQGVYDILQRAIRQLNIFEEKLGLLRKNEQKIARYNNILTKMQELLGEDNYKLLLPYFEEIKNLFD